MPITSAPIGRNRHMSISHRRDKPFIMAVIARYIRAPTNRFAQSPIPNYMACLIPPSLLSWWLLRCPNLWCGYWPSLLFASANFAAYIVCVCGFFFFCIFLCVFFCYANKIIPYRIISRTLEVLCNNAQSLTHSPFVIALVMLDSVCKLKKNQQKNDSISMDYPRYQSKKKLVQKFPGL